MMIFASPPTLLRSIDAYEPPTLLLDETDTIFKGKEKSETQEAIRAVLNAGFQRGRTVPRCVPPTLVVQHFPTFSMAALAGIGNLPDTIEDRSVIIELRRRAPGEKVAKLRWREVRPALHELLYRFDAWVRANLDELRAAYPDLPVDDRAAERWEPLAAIADIAGGDWPQRARKACVVICKTAAGDDAEGDLGFRLLADLRSVFDTDTPDNRAHTDALLDQLRKVDEAPWADYYGRPFNDRDLAKLLGPFGIRSKDVWIEGVNHKGYRKDDFTDAWQRYLPTPVDRNGESPDEEEGDLPGDDDSPGFLPPGARSARSARSGCDQAEHPSRNETVNARSARSPSPPSPNEWEGLGADQAPSGPSGPSAYPQGNGTAPAASTLPNVRCPECRWRFVTAVQAGETAWCKKCAAEFAVPDDRP